MEKLVGLAIVGLAIYTVISHALPATATLAGLDTVAQLPSTFKLLGTPDDATGTFEIKDRASGKLLGAFYTDVDGKLHETPEQAKDGLITATYKPVTTALRLGTDFGSFAGYDSGSDRGVIGFRYSPARIFENIAPDIIAGPEVLGLGISIYPPRTFGPAWLHHVGAGAWYASDLDGSAGFVFGLSLSIK